MGPVMMVIFWVSAALIFYAYAGYPIFLALLSRFARKPVKKGHQEPTVSVVLSAFNEEKNIELKIHNLLNMDYPEHKLEILIGSDGASDSTDHIVSQFRSPRVRFFRFVKNLGKPHILNALAEEANGVILIFTDARQMLDRMALRKLLENFNDPTVGCVSGELIFLKENENPGAGKGFAAYWDYEKTIRKMESQIGSVVGATGALYAIRRSLFPLLPPDILVDDMFIPLSIVEKGHRVVFESEARTYDRPSEAGKHEFVRKVRTLAGNYQIASLLPGLLNPFKSPVAWQLFSHKFMRLAVPFLLVPLFISSAFISGVFYKIFFVLQVLFYLTAAAPAFVIKGPRKGILMIPYAFCVLNYAAAVALLRFLRGEQKVTWEKAYA